MNKKTEHNPLNITTKEIQINNHMKIINLPLPKILARDKKALALFNKGFEENEVHVVPNGKSVNIHVREVDMKKLRRTAKKIGTECALSGEHILLRVSDSLADVKSYGIRNGRRNFVDYDKERKVVGRASKEQKRGKLLYARGDFSSEENVVPKKMQNEIVCLDSKKVLKSLPDNCVDMVFTSPPYNFGLDYQNGQDDKKWDSYFKELFEILNECIRVVKFGGRIVVNVQPLYSDYMPSHHIISNFFLEQGLIWRAEIMWEKNNYNCKYTAWGSWKSPSSPYMKYSWEFLEVFSKGSLKKQGLSVNADITGDEFKKWVYGKWSIAPERGMMDKYGHPAMFPEELARRAMLLFSYKGDLILDPFNGAGTTTAVAKKTGRRYLGIDISPEYCKTAKKRLNDIVL